MARVAEILDQAERDLEAIYSGDDGPVVLRGAGHEPVRCARKYEARRALLRLKRARALLETQPSPTEGLLTVADARGIRKALGLTLKQMGVKLGLSEKWVGLMERGEAPIERRTGLAMLYLKAQHDRAPA